MTARGWDVFGVDGRLEIQRCDEEDTIPSDADALMAAIGAAASGDEYARRALYAVNFQDVEGWNDYASWLQDHEARA